MKTHSQVVATLMRRPGVRREVARILREERVIAKTTPTHSQK
jgi:hypothetical protein